MRNISKTVTGDVDKSTITISQEEFDRLVEASNKLQALINHGVDNWGGYSDAMAELYDED